MTYDLDTIRAQFPALSIADNGMPRIYFDNPAGTQVPLCVADSMTACLLETNANVGGLFETSRRATSLVHDAHVAMADFLHAADPDEIIFGQNMTTITLHLSRSIGRLFKPGDEIILTRMEHDGNVSPWMLMARDMGLEVKWLPFDTDTFEFDLKKLDELLTDKTKLVCVGGASNLTGTINDIKTIASKARAAGALSFIDAVQLAPHVPIDVQDIGCDFLVCSAYKFFGPHQGILWGRRDVLESLEPYKLRPAPDELPGSYETGTQSHEGMAGTIAAVNYFAGIGATMAQEYHPAFARYGERCCHIHAALAYLFDYEEQLARHLIQGLQQLPGIRIQGIADPDALSRRVPTVAVTIDGIDPVLIAEQLGRRNIFVWSGHNYAVEVARHLGIYDQGGALRIGPVHYNSVAELDQLLNALDDILPAVNAA